MNTSNSSSESKKVSKPHNSSTSCERRFTRGTSRQPRVGSRQIFGFHPPPGDLARSSLQLPGFSSGFYPPPGSPARSTLQLLDKSSASIHVQQVLPRPASVLLKEVLHAPHFGCPANLRLPSSSKRSRTLYTSASRRIFGFHPPQGGLARSTLQLPGFSLTCILPQEVLLTNRAAQ
jgi:hypothetical protein